MKRILCVILILFCFTFIFSLYAVDLTRKENYLLIMFGHAKAGEIRELKNMEQEINNFDDNVMLSAYALALYMIKPNQYENQYVISFDAENSEFINNFYAQVEEKNLTPKFMYSFDILGRAALGGNELAIMKVIKSVLYSGGVIAEFFNDFIVKLLLKQTGKTVKILSELQREEREKIYHGFEISLEDEKVLAKIKRRIKKIPLRSIEENLVVNEIDKYSFQSKQ